jgi:uncharacterized protein (DUF3084 family)
MRTLKQAARIRTGRISLLSDQRIDKAIRMAEGMLIKLEALEASQGHGPGSDIDLGIRKLYARIAQLEQAEKTREQRKGKGG